MLNSAFAWSLADTLPSFLHGRATTASSRDQRAHDNWALLKAQELPSGAVMFFDSSPIISILSSSHALALEEKSTAKKQRRPPHP